jgi:hypothetical protein
MTTPSPSSVAELIERADQLVCDSDWSRCRDCLEEVAAALKALQAENVRLLESLRYAMKLLDVPETNHPFESVVRCIVAERDTAREQLARARQFMEHLDGCYWHEVGTACTCGLSDFLAQMEPKAGA